MIRRILPLLFAVALSFSSLAQAQAPPVPTVADQVAASDSALADVAAKRAASQAAQDALSTSLSAEAQADSTLSATLAATGPVAKLTADSTAVVTYASDGKGSVIRTQFPLAGTVAIPTPPAPPAPPAPAVTPQVRALPGKAPLHVNIILQTQPAALARVNGR